MALIIALVLGACAPTSRGDALRPHPTLVSLNPCADAILAEVADPAQILAVSRFSHDPAASSMGVAAARRWAATSGSVEELESVKARLESKGVAVRGPYDHEGWSKSIYFEDPNGLQMEYCVLTREFNANDAVPAVRFHLDLSIRSDFVDLFDVKAHRYFSRGDSVSTWHAGDACWDLVVEYQNGDFQRRFTYRVTDSDSPPRYENGRIEWTVHIPPAGRWCAEAVMLLDVGQGEGPAPGTANHREDRLAAWNARLGQPGAGFTWRSCSRRLSPLVDTLYS